MVIWFYMNQMDNPFGIPVILTATHLKQSSYSIIILCVYSIRNIHSLYTKTCITSSVIQNKAKY